MELSAFFLCISSQNPAPGIFGKGIRLVSPVGGSGEHAWDSAGYSGPPVCFSVESEEPTQAAHM